MSPKSSVIVVGVAPAARVNVQVELGSKSEKVPMVVSPAPSPLESYKSVLGEPSVIEKLPVVATEFEPHLKDYDNYHFARIVQLLGTNTSDNEVTVTCNLVNSNFSLSGNHRP